MDLWYSPHKKGSQGIVVWLNDDPIHPSLDTSVNEHGPALLTTLTQE